MEILLSAYADGELDPRQVSEVEAMIARDPELARLVEAHRRMTALLRAACSDAVYQRALPVLPDVPSRWWRVRPALGWAAAVVALAIGLGTGLNWRSWTADPRERLLDEVAEYHEVYQKETSHLVELPAAQAAELTAWLGKRVGRDILIPDLSFAGLSFAGGRMLVIDGRPAGDLMYTRPNGPPIALCITEADQYGPMTPVRLDEREDLTLASWSHGGQDFVIVGQIDKAMARALAERTRKVYGG
ncbi:MAG: anti-sigma factor [Acetobacteraceae bacterium]